MQAARRTPRIRLANDLSTDLRTYRAPGANAERTTSTCISQTEQRARAKDLGAGSAHERVDGLKVGLGIQAQLADEPQRLRRSPLHVSELAGREIEEQIASKDVRRRVGREGVDVERRLELVKQSIASGSSLAPGRRHARGGHKSDCCGIALRRIARQRCVVWTRCKMMYSEGAKERSSSAGASAAAARFHVEDVSLHWQGVSKTRGLTA